MLTPIRVIARLRDPLGQKDRSRCEGWEKIWPRPDDGDAGLQEFLVGILKRRFGGWAAVLGLEALNASVAGAATLAIGHLAKPLENGEFGAALPFLYFFLILRLLQLLVEIGGNLLVVWIRSEMGCVLRKDTLEKVLRFPMAFYYRIEHGAVVQHVDLDVFTTIDLATRFWLAIFESLFMVIFVGAAAMWLNWQVTLWVLVIALCSIPVIQIARMRVARISKRLFSLNSRISSLLQESLCAIKYVKTMGIEEQESNRLSELLRENRTCEIRAAATQHSIGPLLEFTYLIMVCLILWGTFHLFPGSLRVGTIVPLFYALFRVFPPIRKTVRLVVDFDRSWQSAQRLYWTHAHLSDRAMTHIARKKPALPVSRIEFSHVTFSYTKAAPCLRDASFHLCRGELVALAGESGSGKTTVCDLILGLHDEYSGAIRIGHDLLSEIDRPSYRSLLGYVPQEPLLIHDTIRGNLLYGIDGNVSDDQLVRALRRANAWDFVQNRPDGLGTFLSERGSDLSGGERQRLCLARALLREPQILVMDEGTSMLDLENERALLQVLIGIKKDMIVLFVSHRGQVLDYADRVLMIEDAVVRETAHRGGSSPDRTPVGTHQPEKLAPPSALRL